MYIKTFISSHLELSLIEYLHVTIVLCNNVCAFYVSPAIYRRILQIRPPGGKGSRNTRVDSVTDANYACRTRNHT